MNGLTPTFILKLFIAGIRLTLVGTEAKLLSFVSLRVCSGFSALTYYSYKTNQTTSFKSSILSLLHL